MIGRRGLLGGVVAWWASGNARRVEGPQAREAARLDHRLLGTQRAGVGPAPSQNIIRAQIIIVSGGGAHAGLFVYNGAPGLGTLVAEITAPGVTSDPFGNAIPSSGVLNAGTWNGAGVLTSHYGINNTGDTFLANSSGLTVIHEHSADGSVRYYNASGEGLGNLVASIAPVTGTDGPGNTYQSGITSYTSGKFAQLLSAILTFFQTGNTTNPNVSGAFAQLRLQSGTTAANTAASTVTLQPGASIANLEIDNSSVTLQGIATPGSPATGNTLLFSDVNGFERMLPGLAGDADAYQIGETISILGSTFTINSTTPQTIFTKGLGIGTYIVEIWGVTSNTTAADAAQFAFAFTGTATLALVDYTSMSGTIPAVVDYFGSSTLTSTFNGQGVAGNQQLRVMLTVVVSVAGSLTFTGKELVAANTVSVFGGSRMRTRHVT